MIKVTCKHCKQEVVVPLYFSEAYIHIEDNPQNLQRDYIAMARGRTICPNCGNDIMEFCKCPLYRDDIIDLATRRYSKV